MKQLAMKVGRPYGRGCFWGEGDPFLPDKTLEGVNHPPDEAIIDWVGSPLRPAAHLCAHPPRQVRRGGRCQVDGAVGELALRRGVP